MTFQIPLSQIRANGFADIAEFDAAVDAYIGVMTDHLKTIGVPRPTAHPLVEAVVRRYPPPADLIPGEEASERFASDYEVIDDTPPPPPPPTLDERKRALAEAAAMQAIQAGEVVWPSLTRRLITAKANAAAQVIFDGRSAEQAQDLTLYHELQAKLAAIDIHLGELEMQIHGLTEETIDGWQPGAFPT